MNRTKRIEIILKKHFLNFTINITDNSHLHKGHNNFNGNDETHMLIELKRATDIKVDRLEVHNKIKLAHLITGLGCGGAEKMVYQLCKYADRKKFNLSVISIDKTDYFLSRLESLQINVNMLGLKRSPFSLIRGVFKLNDILRENKIQVIHAHLFHGLILACLVKILNFKIKIIWSSHSSQMSSFIRAGIIYLLKPFNILHKSAISGLVLASLF